MGEADLVRRGLSIADYGRGVAAARVAPRFWHAFDATWNPPPPPATPLPVIVTDRRPSFREGVGEWGGGRSAELDTRGAEELRKPQRNSIISRVYVRTCTSARNTYERSHSVDDVVVPPTRVSKAISSRSSHRKPREERSFESPFARASAERRRRCRAARRDFDWRPEGRGGDGGARGANLRRSRSFLSRGKRPRPNVREDQGD